MPLARVVRLNNIAGAAHSVAASDGLGLGEDALLTTQLYPNMPAGMTLLDQWDGTSITKANWTDTGAPWNTHASVVNDSTNPLGTGQVIQVDFTTADVAFAQHAGAPTRNQFSGGPYSELYIMYRKFYDPNWEQGIGQKHFYFGSPVGSRQNEGCGPCCFFTTNEGEGTAHLGDQHESPANSIWVLTDSTFWDGEYGVWVNIEYHFVCNSAPGASDGEAYLYKNGTLRAQNTSWNAVPSTEAEVGFDGLHWYHQRNAAHNQSEYYRIGELAIFGK